MESDLRKERQRLQSEKARNQDRFERDLKYIKEEKLKLRRESMQLKMEREQMNREKEEVNRLERERTKLERERRERERLEHERETERLKMEKARLAEERQAVKRTLEESYNMSTKSGLGGNKTYSDAPPAKKRAFGEAERRFSSPGRNGNGGGRFNVSKTSNRPGSSSRISTASDEKKNFPAHERAGYPASGGSRPSGPRAMGSKSQAPKHMARKGAEKGIATNRGAMSIAPKVHNSAFPRPTGIASPRMTMGAQKMEKDRVSDFKSGGNVRNVILSREGGLMGRGGGANLATNAKPNWPASGPPNSVVAAGFVRASAGRGGRDKFSRGGRGGRGGFRR